MSLFSPWIATTMTLAVAGHAPRPLGWLDALAIAGLVFINGFFVAAEFALVKVRTSQIEQLAEEGNWAARITSRALDRLDTYLSASQLGITVASLALGTAIESQVKPAVEAVFRWLGITGMDLAIGTMTISIVPLIALSFVTFLHMALGEQAPKSLAIRSAKTIALWTAPPLVLFTYVFWPIIWLLNSASNLTLRLLGLGVSNNAELTHTEEEVRHILSESAAGGHLSRRERLMIENVLNLEEKAARRVMVPRPDIVYLSLARPPEDNMRLARQAGHTRFPLCEDDLSNVVGLIHIKDLFRVGGGGGRLDLRRASRKILFFPESVHLDRLLLEFQKSRVHMAMLLDEYGGVVGMVTLENVLEELVGPIQDEFDRESPRIDEVGPRTFEVDATLPLDTLAEACHMDLPETDAETAGGLIIDLLDRIPKPGDWVDVGAHRLTVLQADPTRIRKVRVEPVGAAAPAPAPPGPAGP